MRLVWAVVLFVLVAVAFRFDPGLNPAPSDSACQYDARSLPTLLCQRVGYATDWATGALYSCLQDSQGNRVRSRAY